MDCAILGGDARFGYLTQLLCVDGFDARWIEGGDFASDVPRDEVTSIIEAKCAVMNWPYPKGLERLAMLPDGATVYFCGPAAPEGIPERLRVVNLWEDERLLVENAWLTAEGAIAAAMRESDAALHDCDCLIVGWGRIGRALTELLVGMNVCVTVASRSEKSRCRAIERGAEVVSTVEIADALPGKRIIFSTPPTQVLGEKELRRVDENVLIIDLASPPYGIDLEAAERLGLRAWREPKLPGRHCPYSAALALKRAMDRKGGI